MRSAKEPAVTYNLFRSKDLGDLYCAVPEDRAIPPFLNAGAWSYDRKLLGDDAPREFDRAAARVGVRFNGFHLFQGL
jgi:hypothetical protein